MGGGTEAFPDLGQHCQEEDCNQLDFLPFICDGCRKVFCLDHRAYKSHGCPRAEHNSRVVVVCEACSVSIEKKADEEAAAVLEKHARSGDCDPNKKSKPKCPVRRCKEQLTFSNCTTCKTCSQKLCLKHRFPSDHNCKSALRKNSNPRVSLTGRIGTDCRDNKPRMPLPPPIEAY